MISRLLYISKAAFAPYSVTDIEIMREADAFNTGAGITGFLVRSGWNYMQVLEGPPTPVKDLADRIGRDGRHFGYIEVFHDQAATRRFGSWSMGYADLSGQNNWITENLSKLSPQSPDVLKLQAVEELEQEARKQEGRL